ncbi:LURP-one-related/scramblase family protein [Paenibacillus sp. strain BS8-2]
MELYFSDRFFSSGTTDIMNEQGEARGTVDLESIMTATLSVYGADSALRYSGKFRFFSGKWEVSDQQGFEVGVLRARFSLFSKKFEYDAGPRGLYTIESPAFSREYTILDQGGNAVASFEKVSGWLQAGAFQLSNSSTSLDSYELIAVVLGVHNIQKRQNNAASGAST